MALTTPSSSIPGNQSSWKSLLDSGWFWPLLAFFILLLLLSAKRIGDFDLGTHLRAGQWIVQNHAFPDKDVFTYTQTDRDYLDSNSLYQVLIYLVQKTLGYSALTLVNMAVILAVFFILLFRLRLSHASWGTVCLCLWVAALMMERRFVIRPEVFSWLFLSLTLWTLDSRNRGRDFLWFLPFLQLAWVNTEGLFVLGWLAMACYSVSGLCHQKKWDPKLVRYFLLSLGADLLNPYFLKGMFFPFILWTRLGGSNLHKQTIIELFSPWEYLRVQNLHYDSNLHVVLFFLVAAAVLLLAALTWKQRKAHEILMCLAFGYLGCASVRNIPLFALVALPILGAAFADFTYQRISPIHGGKKAAWLFTLFLFLAALRVATNAFYTTDRRLDRLGLGLDPNRLPMGAVDFMDENHLDGRILNFLNFGGWLDWQGPQPTFIDGRSEVMSDSFYQEYLQSLGPMGLLTITSHYQPQLILADYNAAPQWAEQLNHFSDWRLVYLDECSALYARKDYEPQIPALQLQDFLKARGIPFETDFSLLSQLRGLKPSAFQSWLRGFYRPQTYAMGDFSLGLFALKVGEYDAARDLFMEGFGKTNGDYGEVFFNLGVASLHLKDYDLGRLCLEYSRELDPANPETLRMLKNLGAL